MSINLHIKRLVIDDIGIQTVHLNELKTAIQSELTLQLRTHGITPALQSRPANKPLNGGFIKSSNRPEPTSFGKQIGKAIFQGINKSPQTQTRTGR